MSFRCQKLFNNFENLDWLVVASGLNQTMQHADETDTCVIKNNALCITESRLAQTF